jgi:lipopolysaccharide export system permease protein
LPRSAGAQACGGRQAAFSLRPVRLLDRYLLRELLVPLGFCLGGFLIFWISSDLLREIDDFQERGLGALDVAEYYLVASPEFLAVVLPLALLLALLYALTNHARHHELTAIRAAGVGLWRLSLPYFLVGLVGSVALLFLNELAAPHSADRAERILNRRSTRQESPEERRWVRNLGFTNARDQRTWQIGGYNVETHEMIEPQVDYMLPDGSRRWLFAARAVRTNDLWLFFDVREYLEDARVNPWLMPARQTNALAMPRFTETPEQIRSELNISRHLSQTILSARKADIPVLEILDYLRLHPHVAGTERQWLHTKLHGRLAAPWTCLVVVLIAIPFGAAPGRRNVFMGVAGSVFICFTYFVVLQLGLAFGTGGYLPPWLAAWAPNLAFGATGAWLTSRVR